MKIDVWHNLLWSRYKAAVFSELVAQGERSGDAVTVYQIAETDSSRAGLAEVEPALHRYPYVPLFKGSYAEVTTLAVVRRVARLTSASQADVTIVAGIERPEYWAQAAILWATGRKRAVFCDSTSYDRPPSFIKNAAKRLFFALVPNALCYGERASAYVRQHGIRPERVFIRRQAAALPESYDAAAIPARRRAAAAGPEAPVFLYVGRLSPEKCIDDLLHAFDAVARGLPGARLRIIGTGPQEAALKAMADGLACAGQVEFAGSRSGDALFAEYLAATALVLPSMSEPWGLVVNEALHFGCPVLVSHRCGCVPELVQDSACGMVFSAGDRSDLAAKLAAAPGAFADVEATARCCLERIAPFNPAAAGSQILEAARRIAAQ